MIVRPAAPADRSRWDGYVRRQPASHFAQLAAWRDVTVAAYGCEARWWLAERGGEMCGALPAFAGGGRSRRLFSAPGGLLADDEEAAAALLDRARGWIRDERFEWLELRDQIRAWPDLATNPEHVTLVLDLEADAEAQWKAFDAKLRNQVRKAEKSGLTTRWGHEHLPAFHRVLLENMRDLGTPIRGPRYYRRVLEAYGEAADLLIVNRGTDAIGAMFVIGHRDVLADPWASSLRRHFAACPNHMLYWEAIRRAIARGYRRFDFGRSQWGSNTFRFKEQWGARPVPLFYQYVLAPSAHVPTLEEQKGRLDLAVRLWKRLPLPVARWLGEPAKRMFPEAL